jgi:hypothetical protein
MHTLNLLLLRHFMPLFGSGYLPRTLILVTCGFSALVINRISIDYGETNLSVFSGGAYEKIIGCNLLYGSCLRPHGLRRQGSDWQGQSSGAGCYYQGLIQFSPAPTL